MNVAVRTEAFATRTVGPLPPCGEELERGVSPMLCAPRLPPSLTLPHKGGGNAAVFLEAACAHSGMTGGGQ